MNKKPVTAYLDEDLYKVLASEKKEYAKKINKTDKETSWSDFLRFIIKKHLRK